ncbi:hypothetical protein D3C72_1585020 [compost metagenome]
MLKPKNPISMKEVRVSVTSIASVPLLLTSIANNRVSPLARLANVWLVTGCKYLTPRSMSFCCAFAPVTNAPNNARLVKIFFMLFLFK